MDNRDAYLPAKYYLPVPVERFVYEPRYLFYEGGFCVDGLLALANGEL
jgi:hypothetical protein